MQHTTKEVPVGCAAGLLLMVVGPGIGREDSRVDLGSIWSSVIVIERIFVEVFPVCKEMLLRLGLLVFWVILSMSGACLGAGCIV